MAEHLAEPAWKALLARLERSAEFRAVWARHEVVAQGGRAKYIRNAHVGLLHLDEESRERLEELRSLAVAAATS